MATTRRRCTLIICAALMGCSYPDQTGGRLDAEGVVALLDVMDAIAELHPGFEERAEALGLQPNSERATAFAAARRRNQESAVLNSTIERMLATETYQVYFRRFENVTADMVRDLILDLPYRDRAAPGDIGGTLFDLVRQREQVRLSLDRLRNEVNMGWVYRTAERWAPKSGRELPVMHLIYDSNAGSFAAEGVPFFNLYGRIRLDMPGPDSAGSVVLEVERIMAHELQHVLAEPVLYPIGRPDHTWQQESVDRLMRAMVGEGVALHCNPPTGVKQEIYEDETIVTALVRRLDSALVSLSRDEATEDEMRAWERANYQENAEEMLRDYMGERFSGEQLEMQLRRYMSLRPDLVHVLGWWMVSRISGGGDRAVSLLFDPNALFELYNGAVGEDRQTLQVSPEALRYVRTLFGAHQISTRQR